MTDTNRTSANGIAIAKAVSLTLYPAVLKLAYLAGLGVFGVWTDVTMFNSYPHCIATRLTPCARATSGRPCSVMPSLQGRGTVR